MVDLVEKLIPLLLLLDSDWTLHRVCGIKLQKLEGHHYRSNAFRSCIVDWRLHPKPVGTWLGLNTVLHWHTQVSYPRITSESLMSVDIHKNVWYLRRVTGQPHIFQLVVLHLYRLVAPVSFLIVAFPLQLDLVFCLVIANRNDNPERIICRNKVAVDEVVNVNPKLERLLLRLFYWVALQHLVQRLLRAHNVECYQYATQVTSAFAERFCVVFS